MRAERALSLDVDGILGPNGALRAAMGRYEHRPEQLRVAREVERAFKSRELLLAEAGTGTGKTLAYLVPAVLSGRKVVVSTATKTLQEQVFFKDIPLLKEKVGLPFEAALLKGRSNYLCLQRFESFGAAPEFPSRDDAALWPMLKAWALKTETGDRAELELPDAFSTWSELSTTSEGCLGQKCPNYEPCFVTRARRAAEHADVLVVNHHLFFADLALKGRGARAGEGVIPRYEAVIFDEAHALEAIASEYFGASVSNWRFEDLVRDCLKALPTTDERGGLLCAMALQLRSRSEIFFKAASQKLRMPYGEDASVPLSVHSLAGLGGHAAELVQTLAGIASFAAGAEEPEVLAVGRRATELGGDFDFIRAADSLEHVFWAESRRSGLFLKAAPIEVAKELRARLYGSVDTAVFTSATLTADGRFDFFAQRMGLVAEANDDLTVREVRVDSPFQFAKQAALYVPSHLPEPASPGFIEAVSEELMQLAEVTSGRAFFLFTSLRNMEAAHGLLKNRLPYQVLLQGERPKSVLLKEFISMPSVLFASHSFWEGVDVPGDALSLVVIDKLPFASPQDPLVAARIKKLQDEGQDPFNAYQLPEAAIALRQGFGRLIRSREDRGVVAILDRRLHARAYGRTLLRSLPPARRVDSVDALRRWF